MFEPHQVNLSPVPYAVDVVIDVIDKWNLLLKLEVLTTKID